MTVRRAAALLGGALVLALAGCGGDDKPSEAPPKAKASMKLSSTAFKDGGTIPTRYTCSGKELSPPLEWSGVPKGAVELTLLVEDPDADNFVHWQMLGLPPAAIGIDEGPASAPAGGDGGDWTGPCPPEGDDPHRYVFSIYATDKRLGLDDEASIDDVHEALGKHAIARGTLTGRFGR
jgi:Raf kinase inhibitor-like YbhB/YbcL family protein